MCKCANFLNSILKINLLKLRNEKRKTRNEIIELQKTKTIIKHQQTRNEKQETKIIELQKNKTIIKHQETRNEKRETK